MNALKPETTEGADQMLPPLEMPEWSDELKEAGQSAWPTPETLTPEDLPATEEMTSAFVIEPEIAPGFPKTPTEIEEDDESAIISQLPEVITADMLRARKRKKFDLFNDDFEIPAELLVGIEEDDEPDNIETQEAEQGQMGKDKPKIKKVARVDAKSKGKKRSHSYEDDEEFEGYY
jgi:hypothetical protein